MYSNTKACGVQKRALNLLDLELEVVVSYLTWVLGTEFGSSARVADTLTEGHCPPK